MTARHVAAGSVPPTLASAFSRGGSNQASSKKMDELRCEHHRPQQPPDRTFTTYQLVQRPDNKCTVADSGER